MGKIIKYLLTKNKYGVLVGVEVELKGKLMMSYALNI